MLNFITAAPQSRRTLIFGSAMHIWSDLYFALLIPLLPLIKEDLDLSFAEIGLLRSVFNGASGILQIPAGFLAERVGEFWPLIGGNIWVSLGLIGMAIAPVFFVLLTASFVAGLGGGFQHPLASSMVSRAYEDKRRSTAVGTVNFAGDLGKMASPLVASAFAISLGWRPALWTIGTLGVVFMCVSSLFRRAIDIDKARVGDSHVISGDAKRTQKRGFITLSSVGFLDSATRAGALVYLPFVLDAKGMGTTQLSAMLFLLFTGGAAGKFICGWLGDRYNIVHVIWWTKGLTALLLMASVIASPLAMAPLMLVLGIGLNGTSSVLYATVAELVPDHRRARLYGLYYTTNEGGTVIAPLIYGFIADLANLNVSMVVMGALTAAILPASLALRKYMIHSTLNGPGERVDLRPPSSP